MLGEANESGHDEPAYVVCAAAQTIQALCIGAGDFMSGRIADLFPRLEKMYRQVKNKVLAGVPPGTRGYERQTSATTRGETDDLAPHENQIRERADGQTTMAGAALYYTNPGSSGTDRRVFDALTDLLVTILDHVRMNEDMADTVSELLVALVEMPGKACVRDALARKNADALWVAREQHMSEYERAMGIRDGRDPAWRETPKPSLGILQSSGWTLRDVVF